MLQDKAKFGRCCPPPAATPLSGQLAEDLATLAKAMAHPARVQILVRLIEKGVCMSGDLANELPLAASTVSEHLRVLRESGLIQGTIDGPRRCYCVNPRVLEYFQQLVATLCPNATAPDVLI